MATAPAVPALIEFAFPERTHQSAAGDAIQPAYEVRYAQQLSSGENKTYYTVIRTLPDGYRITTAAEELALQLQAQEKRENPEESSLFTGLFARENGSVPYTWQWTSTALRVPEGKEDPTRPDYRDDEGRLYWLRQVLIGTTVVGEVYVPEGHGRIVAEWNEVYGLPAATIEDQPYPHKPYTAHFWFEPNPPTDRISGQKDVAVGRDARWPISHSGKCLAIGADYGRWSAGYGDSYRLAQGDVVMPIFEGSGVETIYSRIRGEILEEIRQDWVTLPAQAFAEKYGLD